MMLYDSTSSVDQLQKFFYCYIKPVTYSPQLVNCSQRVPDLYKTNAGNTSHYYVGPCRYRIPSHLQTRPWKLPSLTWAQGIPKSLKNCLGGCCSLGSGMTIRQIPE